MKLMAKVKLLSTKEQCALLLRTLELANAACNFLSELAWKSRTFRQFNLQQLAYYAAREQFPGLSSQMIVRAIAKVADAYKLDKRTPRTFQPHGAIAYDDRILRWYTERSEVSIWAGGGRERISFVCGDRQRELLRSRQGESDLLYHRGEFYLLATCTIEEPPLSEVDDVLGIDLGIVNVATDSDGTIFAGSKVNNVRHRHRRLRAKLQKKGTKSAKRLLKSLSGKEARFARDVNHCISKQIVANAQGTRRGIALEDLGGIRNRVTARRSQRATLHSWSFYQLGSFIAYKAQRVGVPVFWVDPRNTSRTCPSCGTIDKRNRPNQATFSCVSCGFAGLADHIAAGIIARRAVINLPNVASLTARLQAPFLTGSS